jgi:hypothetical protein
MAKSIVVTKKKTGQTPDRSGHAIGERWNDSELALIDKWIKATDADLSRGEAIRRLVEIGLTRTPASAPRERVRGSKVAGQQIDRMVDQSATPEERDRRKRRLLKGPREFRAMREK